MSEEIKLQKSEQNQLVINTSESAALKREAVTELAGAINRYKELQETKILSPQLDAERKGLAQYIQRVLCENASEFVGCWFVANLEYRPLVAALSPMIGRVCQQVCAQQCNPTEQAK